MTVKNHFTIEQAKAIGEKGKKRKKLSISSIVLLFFICWAVLIFIGTLIWGYSKYVEQKKYLTTDAGKECFSRNECDGYCTLPPEALKMVNKDSMIIYSDEFIAAYAGSNKRGVCSRYNAYYESLQLHFNKGQIGFRHFD